MKTNRILVALFMLISLAEIRPLLAQSDIKEQLTIPLTDPNKPGSLHVGIINGSIHVVGYAGKEVVVDAVAEAYTSKKKEEKPDELANGMKRISTRGGLDLSAEEKNNKINLSSGGSMKRNVNLTIKVPQQFSLKVSTINHGDIVIENVTGELEVNNVNGPITLTGVSGSAVANSVNGPLKATFKNVNSEAPMAFSTLNGNVDVTFPANAKFDVKLKSDRGEIFSDFDVDVDKSQPKASRSSKDGMYKVSIDDWVQGKVNGGGREVMMKNMHGNIYIRRAK
ncbi:DUF4097 family beta strand repeat-containing protein [Larkinella humicola]|uniref:DUF4097 domain-containing protein n=1 Tax=Larkinella humicola TaxID=2607654 RepID=A0A5N1J3H5_9BACT|nr:DUF4097 family beta strand repeat-containing protein [Larkinella humicola]KAA9345461.1 DUF4097 domain-containing protein [Larkinella humicola]